MLGIVMAVWSLLIWPFVFRFSATLGSDCLLTGYILIRTIGIGMKLDWKLVYTKNGPDLVLRLSGKKETSARNMNMNGSVREKAERALQTSPVLKKNLLRYLTQTKLIADIRIGLNDAAKTALTCATINAVFGCLPMVKGHVIPDFQRETLCVEVRCISAFRLGKLLLSAALFLYAFMHQAVRQKTGGVVNG